MADFKSAFSCLSEESWREIYALVISCFNNCFLNSISFLSGEKWYETDDISRSDNQHKGIQDINVFCPKEDSRGAIYEHCCSCAETKENEKTRINKDPNNKEDFI